VFKFWIDIRFARRFFLELKFRKMELIDFDLIVRRIEMDKKVRAKEVNSKVKCQTPCAVDQKNRRRSFSKIEINFEFCLKITGQNT